MMTLEQQRIAIAEWMEAKHIQFVGSKAWTFQSYNDSEDLLCPITDEQGCLEDVPNYPSDLNAMHEAEKKLNPSERVKYVYAIWELTKDEWTHGQSREFLSINATSQQRSEALCRTLFPEKFI